MEQNITFSIIGSCVCRDSLENGPNAFTVKNDFRFMNPFSMDSKSIFSIFNPNIFKSKYKPLDGNWYRKNVLHEINKTYFASLKEYHGDYLIIDFAEARLPLLEISTSSNKKMYITFSTIFKNYYQKTFKKTIFKNCNVKIINPREIGLQDWTRIINNFCDEILKIFDESHIILINTKPALFYIGKDNCLKTYSTKFHLDNIYQLEELTPKLNGIFLKRCPNASLIDLPNNLCGDENHVWKNHPLHFIDEVYSYIHQAIFNVVALNVEQNKKNIKFSEAKINKKMKISKTNSCLNECYCNSDYKSVIENDEILAKLSRRKKLLLLFVLSKKEFVKTIFNIKVH